MKLKPKHLEFVLNYLGTKDPAVAYGRTYPNASWKSYSAGASRILARPEVRDYIEFTERRMEDRLLTQIEAEQEAKKQQLLSINEKRAVLTRIITGETKRIRFIKNKYGPQKVEEDLPVYAVLRAVDMDTRLETFYNILLHRQDWSTQQSRTTYINTPTLQQQVNILISQTSQEQNVNVNSPLEGDSLAEAGGCTLAQGQLAQEQEISLPFRGIGGKPTPKQILSQSITCPPLELHPQEQFAQEKSPVSGADSYRHRGPLASEKKPLRLTKVNKTEKPIYNTDAKSTTKLQEEKPKKTSPLGRGVGVGSLAKGQLPQVAPHPSINYNPYTLEPLDPDTDYSYKPSTTNPPTVSYTAPIPGKMTVRPCMKEYD